MRAVLIKGGKGTSSSLYIGEAPTPTRQTPTDVLVRVKAFGLNRMDILQREGNYPLPPDASKTILGVEFSGVVEELPDDNSEGLKKGDKVFGLIAGGAYAEYLICHESLLFKFPEQGDFDFAKAAAIPEVWLTATQVVLMVGRLEPNSNFLFHAGASSVGLAALQIAQGENAKRIFCTVGSDSKKEFLVKNIGAKKPTSEFIPINYKTEDFAKVVQEYTKDDGGLQLIIDPVGQSYFARDVAILARDGALVLMGLLSGGVVPGSFDITPIMAKALRVEGTTLRARNLQYKKKLRDLFEKRVFPHILSGEYSVFIEKEFDWEDIIAAHDLMESNTTTGKIIVHIK